jgi:cyclohexa-1,5-dienecarbonyl-CoA hydratase
VLHADVPTLARVSGLCLGGGFELALACSMIWCDEEAKLGVPEITLGVFPPVASVLLPLKTSDAIAIDMILTGRTLSASEAARTGIVNRVVPAGTLDAALDDFVSTSILPASASSLRLAVAAARSRLRRRYGDEIARLESSYLGTLMSTHDAVEGIRAFLEKRKPVWRDS